MKEPYEIDQNLDRIFKDIDGMYKDIVRLVGLDSMGEVLDVINAIQKLRDRIWDKYPDLPKKEWDED